MRRAVLALGATAAFAAALWLPSWVRDRNYPPELDELLRRYPQVRMEELRHLNDLELRKLNPSHPYERGIAFRLVTDPSWQGEARLLLADAMRNPILKREYPAQMASVEMVLDAPSRPFIRYRVHWCGYDE